MSPHLRGEFVEYYNGYVRGYSKAALFSRTRHNREEIYKELELEAVDVDVFRPVIFSKPIPTLRAVFGGQIMAQAILAAYRTVPKGYVLHSVHTYFLLAGDPTRLATYHVDRIADGASFARRSVTAKQGGRKFVMLLASFHRAEAARLSHQVAMPSVPPPENCATREEFLESQLPEARGNAVYTKLLEDNLQICRELASPIEMRYLDITDCQWHKWWKKEAGPAVSQFWFRCKRALPDRLEVHQALGAYLSDNGMVVCSGKPLAHPHTAFSLVGSLDHTVWFHAPFRADEWLLFDLRTVRSSSNRNLNRAHIFTEAGVLVMTMAQELIMRLDEKQNTARGPTDVLLPQPKL